jgi:heme exporter protein CcmD
MDLEAAHAGFVIAAYAVSTLCILALVIYILLKDKKTKQDA